MLIPYVMDEEELVNELRGLWFACDALIGHKEAQKEEWTDEESLLFDAQQIAVKRLKSLNKSILPS
jgi:hypothetical protein